MTNVGSAVGNKKHVEADDLADAKVMDASTYLDVADAQSNESFVYQHGYGTAHYEDNRGNAFADIKVTPDGGTTVNDAEGTLRLVVYEDSTKEIVRALGPEFSLRELREAKAEAPSDRPTIPQKNPAARPDRHVAWQVKIDSSQDGQELYAAGSTVFLPYAEILQ